MVNDERLLCRPDEQHSGRRQQALELFQSLPPRQPVKIDEQVAAEDKIVVRPVRQKVRAEQVRLGEADALTHRWDEEKPFFDWLKPTVSKGEVLASKRVAAVDAMARLGQSAGAE